MTFPSPLLTPLSIFCAEPLFMEHPPSGTPILKVPSTPPPEYPPPLRGEPNHSPLHQIPLMSLMFWHFGRHFWSCVLAYLYLHHRPISPLQSQIICLDLLFALRTPMFLRSLFHFAQLGLASPQTSFRVRLSLACSAGVFWAGGSFLFMFVLL